VESRSAVARAFEAGVGGIQIQQAREITLSARIQPIYDNGYLIEIPGHVGHGFRTLHRTGVLGNSRENAGIALNGR
jgi:hypothetical protein